MLQNKSYLFVKLPLQLCFLVFPLAAILSRLISESYFRIWLDIAWVFVVFSIFFYILLGGKTFNKYGWRLIGVILILFMIFLLRAAFTYVIGDPLEISAIPIELKIFLYAFLSALIVGVAGVPNRETWSRVGVGLAVIILLDTAIESIAIGSLTRPQGSGEVNYDAMLLAIALGFMVLQPNKNHGQNIFSNIIVLVALVATQSRTMLLSATLMLFLFAKFNILTRLIFLVTGLIGVFAMFMIRDLEVSLESVDRYWMWSSGLNLIMDPSIFFFGVSPGQPLNVDAPKALQELWEQQTEKISIGGVFPFNFHAFWLRFSINFGVPFSIILLLILFIIVARGMIPVRRYLCGLFVFSGFTMGTIYLSNVAIPLFLAMASSYYINKSK